MNGGSRLERLIVVLTLFAGQGFAGGADEPPAVGANSRTEIEALPTWSLASEPDVSIGVLDGEPVEEFGLIRAGALGPHGIYVLDGQNREVRIFDVAGDHVMSLGGEGDGPGEFRNPVGLRVGLDSTVAVWDEDLHRLTVFSHEGDVLRTASVRQRFLNPRLESVLPDGRFVLSDFRFPPGVLEGAAGVGSLVAIGYSPDGELRDTLQKLAGPHTSGIGLLSKPYATPDLVAAAEDGIWVLRVDSALIVRLDLSGDTLQSVSWEPLPRHVTESDLDAWEAFMSERSSDSERQATLARHLRRPGFAAERHPVAWKLLTDRHGRIWIVERHDLERVEAPTWLVFGPSGSLAGVWEEPSGSLTLLDADESMALVTITDDLGIQRVELRALMEDGRPLSAASGG